MIDLILSLRRKGWSQRRIAPELDLNRETVARYLKQARGDPKPAIAPPGSDNPDAAPKPAIAPPGSEQPGHGAQSQMSRCWAQPRWQQSIPWSRQ